MSEIREIIACHDPRLRQPVRAIERQEFDTKYIQELARDVLRCAIEGTPTRNKSVGLAAIQLGELVSFVAVDLQADRIRTGRQVQPEFIGLANLVVTPVSEEIITDVEGCHSVSSLAGLVPRPRRVHIKGDKLDGSVFEDEVEGANGFVARVFQHEADHNDGYTFVGRVANDNHLFWVPAEGFKTFMANPLAWPAAEPDMVQEYRSYTQP